MASTVHGNSLGSSDWTHHGHNHRETQFFENFMEHRPYLDKSAATRPQYPNSLSSMASSYNQQSLHSLQSQVQDHGEVGNNQGYEQETYNDLETDSIIEPKPVNDNMASVQDRPGISFQKFSSSDDKSLSSDILPSSSMDVDVKDTNSHNEKQSSLTNMTELNKRQTYEDDLEVDGNATNIKTYYEKSSDQWPQENGCANRIKAKDMNRRSQRVKQTVNNFSRTYEDITSTEYKHDHLYRGRCLIVSNSVFQDKRDRPKRKGSLRDAKTVRRQFLNLGFHPIKRSDGSEEMIHENLTREELFQILSEATDSSLNDHSDYDCFVCVILSYGVEGAVVCPGETIDTFVEMKSILEYFSSQRCPSLAMKPKLFFVQGCTPYEITESQAMASKTSPEIEFPKVTSSLPSMVDCLVQFSGVDGSLGWGRNRHRGLSYYAEALCRSLKDFCFLKIEKGQKSQEISSLVLSINRAFVRILEDDDLFIDEVYCAPTTISTFTKRMHFYPKKTEDDLDMDTG